MGVSPSPAACGSPGYGVRYRMREVVTAWGNLTDHPLSYTILTKPSILLKYADDCAAEVCVGICLIGAMIETKKVEKGGSRGGCRIDLGS